IAARAAEIYAEPREILFHEGDDSRGVFIVVEGRVELKKREAVVLEMNPGSTYGEFIAGSDERHGYTGAAAIETHLLNIQHEDVVEVMLDYPEFALALVRVHAQRVNHLTQRMVELEEEIKSLSEALGRGVSTPPPAQAGGAE